MHERELAIICRSWMWKRKWKLEGEAVEATNVCGSGSWKRKKGTASASTFAVYIEPKNLNVVQFLKNSTTKSESVIDHH